MQNEHYVEGIEITFLHEKWEHQDAVQFELRNMNDPEDSDPPEFGQPRFSEHDMRTIAGVNGSGKTTLLKLIKSFFDQLNSGDLDPEQFKKNYLEKGVKLFKVGIRKLIYAWNEGFRTFGQNYSFNDNLTLNWWKTQSTLEYIQEHRLDYCSIFGITPHTTHERYLEIMKDERISEEIFELFWKEDYEDIRMWALNEFIFDFENDIFEFELSINYEWNRELPNQTFFLSPSISKKFEGQPFGPENLTEKFLNLIEEISDPEIMVVTPPDNVNYVLPLIDCAYVSAQEIQTLNKKFTGELLEHIVSDDTYSLENELSEKSESFLANKFGIVENNIPLRSYAELPRTWDGSVESFEFGVGNSIKEMNTGEEIDSISFATTELMDNEDTFNPRIISTSQATSQGIPHYERWCVFVCKIHNIKSRDFDVFRRVHRYAGEVIYCEDSGLIFSPNRNRLFEFLRVELVRLMPTIVDKIRLISKLFDLDESEALAVNALSEFTDVNSKYLTSGEKRLFSLLKEACATNVDLLLVDEPEVSLHIDWARKIINLIRKYSSASYTIFSTHSPDVIYNHTESLVELDSNISA